MIRNLLISKSDDILNRMSVLRGKQSINQIDLGIEFIK